MLHRLRQTLLHLRIGLADALTGPLALTFLPATLLVAILARGEMAFLLGAIVMPCAVVLIGLTDRGRREQQYALDELPSKLARHSLEGALGAALERTAKRSGSAICIMVALDRPETRNCFDIDQCGAMMAKDVARRLALSLRRRDRVFDLGKGRLGIVITLSRSGSDDVVLTLAARLQANLQAPISIKGTNISCSASLGVAASRNTRAETGAELIKRASKALDESVGLAPSTIRVHSFASTPISASSIQPADDACRALAEGEICAWFQPQLCTDTGAVSGFESLARWSHPQRGIILPGRFPAPTRRKRIHGLAAGSSTWRGSGRNAQMACARHRDSICQCQFTT